MPGYADQRSDSAVFTGQKSDTPPAKAAKLYCTP